MPKLANKNVLATTVAGVDFPTPVLNASGAFNPTLFNKLFELNQTLGGIVTKTVTAQPRVGNVQQRTAELPGVGMLNSIGLQNPGLAHFIAEDGPTFKDFGIPLVLSLSAASPKEFAEMIAQVESSEKKTRLADVYELNLSCPNVAKGVEFSTSPQLVNEVIAAAVSATTRPVFAKLTPNVADMVPIAGAAIEAGAAGITAINTVYGAAIDVKTKTPILSRVTGGYSGPGIKPVAIHHVYRLRQHFPQTSIMGVGGIRSAQDVLEFMMAGASLVQLGTVCFRHPAVFAEVIDGLTRYCAENDLDQLASIVGCAQQ